MKQWFIGFSAEKNENPDHPQMHVINPMVFPSLKAEMSSEN